MSKFETQVDYLQQRIMLRHSIFIDRHIYDDDACTNSSLATRYHGAINAL